MDLHKLISYYAKKKGKKYVRDGGFEFTENEGKLTIDRWDEDILGEKPTIEDLLKIWEEETIDIEIHDTEIYNDKKVNERKELYTLFSYLMDEIHKERKPEYVKKNIFSHLNF